MAVAVNAKIRQSAGAAVPRGAGSSDCPQRAIIRPSAPAHTASSTLSVSSCRMRRPRVAPIESLTESSRWRVAAREKKVRHIRADEQEDERDDGADDESALIWLSSLS